MGFLMNYCLFPLSLIPLAQSAWQCTIGTRSSKMPAQSIGAYPLPGAHLLGSKYPATLPRIHAAGPHNHQHDPKHLALNPHSPNQY